jgi:Undecaprenyl-phosphate glucose phosphotransferase
VNQHLPADRTLAEQQAPAGAWSPDREAFRALAQEQPKSVYSTGVLAGLVSAGEWAAIVLASAIPYYVHVATRMRPDALYLIFVAFVASNAIVVFHSLRLYTMHAFRRPLLSAARMAFACIVLVVAVVAATFFLKAENEISRVWIATWCALAIAFLTLIRFGLATFILALTRSGRLQRRVAVVGGGELGRDVLRDLKTAHPSEIRILGVFDDRSDARSPRAVEGFRKLGTVGDLVEFARVSRVDLVIFALPITAEERILTMLQKLWVLPLDIRLSAHSNRLRFRPRSYSYVGQLPVLDLLDKPIADWDVVIKTVFDKVTGSLALIALSPVLALTALAIKLDSPGPILFKQRRYGFNNELIEIYKFRSMYVGQLDVDAAKLVTRDDPRVTRVGRLIRRTSIDELPQLFNVVFKGDLSLVGPRPHAVQAKAAERHYDEVVDGYFARHRVKPGITGWAQINGWRGETDTQEKLQHRVEHDLYYIENWSLLFDLRILALTPISIVRASNAF